MALSVLDGNQSATTLSSVVTGGEHIVAHSVVSLGSTAISNITSAVSGSVVTIPSLARIANSAATDGIADTTLNFIKIGGHQSGSNQTAHIVHVSTGGAMSVDATDSVVSISNFPSTQTIAGTVTANLDGYSQTAVSYSVSSVTAIPVALQTNGVYGGTLLAYNGANTFLRVGLDAVGGTALASGNSVPVSGTVTIGSISAAVLPRWEDDNQGGNQRTVKQSTPFPVRIYGDASSTSVTFGATIANSVTIGSLPAISGTVTANGGDFASKNTTQPASAIQLGFQNVGGDFVSVKDDAPLPVNIFVNDQRVGDVAVPISGTVTAAAPNGSLTTRFGTPTTANTAFATSAVTNASRKYLLIQNVTTGSNVITVGIGFTPTTTQGIQLTAGAGITFESSYIPTGAVYVLSSVTASNFTILEA